MTHDCWKVMLKSGKYEQVHMLFTKMKNSGSTLKANTYRGSFICMFSTNGGCLDPWLDISLTCDCSSCQSFLGGRKCQWSYWGSQGHGTKRSSWICQCLLWTSLLSMLPWEVARCISRGGFLVNTYLTYLAYDILGPLLRIVYFFDSRIYTSWLQWIYVRPAMMVFFSFFFFMILAINLSKRVAAMFITI